MRNRGRSPRSATIVFLFAASLIMGCELFSSPPKNNAPVIAAIAGAAAVDMGASTALSCDASDPDGDALSYSWSATAGSLSSTSGQSVAWTAPDSDQGATISCTVNDGNQHAATKTKTMTVNPVNRPVKNLVIVNGNGQLTLRWTNPTVSTFSGVQIQRSATGLVSSVTAGTMVYSGSDQSFTDIDLANGTAYYYSVFSLDTKGTYSIPATVSGKPSSDTTAPGAPSNPSAAAGDKALTLSWGLPSDADFAGVLLLRKDSGSPSGIADGIKLLESASATSYVDSSLANGTTYYYAVYAYDASRNYSVPATIAAMPRGDVTPPAVPQGFTAIPGDAKASLSWTLPADADLAGVKLLRKTGSFSASSSDGTVLIDSANATSYGDASLANGTSYYYSLYAYDKAGNYSAPTTASCAPTNDTSPPGDIASFAATPGNAKVYLSWKNPSDSDYAGVLIIRKAGGQPSSKTDGTQVYKGNSTSYADTSGAANGTTWWYRAFAYDQSENYASGVAISATPAADIPPIYSLTLVNTFNSPDTQPLSIAWDGAYLWLAGGANNSFYKIDAKSGEVLESHNCGVEMYDEYAGYRNWGNGNGWGWPGSFINTFVFKNGVPWVIYYPGNGGAGSLKPLNFTSDSIGDGITLAINGTRGMAYDGSYVWAINAQNNIVKIDSTTGSTVLTVSAPRDNYNTGLALSNDLKQIYLGNFSTNKIYFINKADASVLAIANLPYSAAQNSGYAVRGLCNDGTYIWLTDLNTQKIYKCSLTVLQ